ncbi:MAG: type III glutamate--ammonia ligase [Alphaproteobacteria bacterium]|nr:type III glutamate--ammonia ligase [Alphaproteobacteria bacterium]
MSNPSRAARASGADDLAAIRQRLTGSGVKYCLASYVDVHGVTKAKAVPIGHFERMMRGSELFTGAAIEGLGQGPQDDELAVFPDPNAVTILPWQPEVAWAPGNLKFRGTPWPMCSRNILARQVERAAKLGYRFNLGVECEVFLVRREQGGIVPANPLDVMPKAAYDVIGLLQAMPFVDEVISHMDRLGWHVHSLDHEDANSQFEFDFAYADVLTMADRFTLWRMMMHEVARKHGYIATVMPKPYSNRTGNGAHFNMSIESIDGGVNLFGDRNDRRGCGLSPLAYHFIAGILRHAPAIVATTCPTVNSYKRLVKSGSMTGYTWAPVFISYGRNNRTHMLRVPWVRPEVEGDGPSEGPNLSSARIECRAVDTSLNPYLGAAMMLAAGLEGIEQRLDAGDPINRNMYEQSDEQLKELGVRTLPRTLLEAVEAFAADPLGRDVMGDDLYRSFIQLKTAEWWRYHNTVSQWEYDEYLEKW